MATTGYPANLNHTPGKDDHDDSVTVEFRGVTVTITLRSESVGDPKTPLVFVDTMTDDVAVYVNDDIVFDGSVR